MHSEADIASAAGHVGLVPEADIVRMSVRNSVLRNDGRVVVFTPKLKMEDESPDLHLAILSFHQAEYGYHANNLGPGGIECRLVNGANKTDEKMTSYFYQSSL
jgi:hypothetical protein